MDYCEALILPQEKNSRMVDIDTFLTTLYVMVDEFCQTHVESATGAATVSFC